MEQTLQIFSNATGTNTELLNIKLSREVDDIVVRLDLDQNQCTSANSINLNSHQEVFQEILLQVSKTPYEVSFLNILHHLLSIDPSAELCGQMWKVSEKLLHRATQLESLEDAERLLSATVTRKNCSAKIVEATTASTTPLPNVTGLPPPQPLTSGPGLPPPPPPPLGVSQLPPNNTNANKPSTKLRIINWSKIPPHKIRNKSNIYTTKKRNERPPKYVKEINFESIEELFALQTKQDVDGVDGGCGTDKKLKNGPKKEHFLSNQFSVNINILLKNLKSYTIENIVQLIIVGDSKTMGLEKLKELKKFVQEDNEMGKVTKFKGDYKHLADAEKFLFLLLKVQNYKLRLDSMILKEEYAINLEFLESSIDGIIQAGNDLMKSEKLPDILDFIIYVGNFVNYGSYAGNAIGIEISSLNMLTEFKANKTDMHFLHIIAMELENYNPQLLDFTDELSSLQNVQKLNINEIEKEFKNLEYELNTIRNQIELLTTEEDIKQQMGEFFRNAADKMEKLKKQLEELHDLRIAMAEYFCEDVTTFKIEQCFDIFHNFCEQFKQTLKENQERQEFEIRMEMRRKQKEEQQLAINALSANKDRAISYRLQNKQQRSRKNDINRKLIETEDSSGNRLRMNNKRNEDDLMAFLQVSQRKGEKVCKARKTRLKVEVFHERERIPSFEYNNETIDEIPTSDKKSKLNIVKKSWSRLMQSYKASQLKDKCLTSDITSRRQSLQILIRSNSTAYGRTKNQSFVEKMFKTAIPQTGSIFIFPENNRQREKINSEQQEFVNSIRIPKDSNDNRSSASRESQVEMKRPKIYFQTVANVARLKRYSSINEEDIKMTIANLRSTKSKLPSTKLSDFSLTVAKDNAEIIKTLPLEDNSCYTEDNLIEEESVRKLPEIIASKQNTTKESQFEIRNSLYSCSKDLCKANDISPENNTLNETIIAKEESSQKLPKIRAPTTDIEQQNDMVLPEDKTINETIRETEKPSQHLTEILAPTTDPEQQNNMLSKPNRSPSLMTKFQKKFRALLPF